MNLNTLTRICLLLLGIVGSRHVVAQLDVFGTYEDYVNNTPRSHPDATFKKWKEFRNSKLIFVDGNKEEVIIDCPSVWGFRYKAKLFRVSGESKYFVKKGYCPQGTPYLLISSDEMMYYENGLFHLDAMKKEQKTATLLNNCAMISKTLNGDLVFVDCSDPLPWMDEQVLLFLSEYEDLADRHAFVVQYKEEHSHGFGSRAGRGCITYSCIGTANYNHAHPDNPIPASFK